MLRRFGVLASMMLLGLYNKVLEEGNLHVKVFMQSRKVVLSPYQSGFRREGRNHEPCHLSRSEIMKARVNKKNLFFDVEKEGFMITLGMIDLRGRIGFKFFCVFDRFM